MLYGLFICHFKPANTVLATTKRRVVVLKAIVGASPLSSIHKSARLVILTFWFELGN